MALFNNKEDIVIFKNIEHLRELVRFYLQHPHERERIAHNAREKVLNNHTYAHRIKKMLDIISQGQ